MNCWMYEEFRGTRLSFHVTDVLFTGRSDFQTMQIVDTETRGRVLFLDDIVMLSERFEFIYHDMISHVPLFVHPAPERVLIIGGGDGGTAREVLRHPEVKQVDMVEIDEMVVNGCREFIPLTSCELDNPRLNLMIGDGIDFVRKAKNAYQVILVDSTDPIGPAKGLFGESFYRDVFSALTDDGIVVGQSESPFASPDLFADYLRIVTSIFPRTFPYLMFTPDYPTGQWSFTFSSKKYHPLDDFDRKRCEAAGLETKYYNPDMHRAAFALPEAAKQLAGIGKR